MKKQRIVFNSPVILGFAAVCVAVQLISMLTGGASNRLLFSVYRSSLLSPLTYLRFVGHIFGHSGWEHLLNNMMCILILGPMLEEKYGGRRLMLLMLAAALVTGLIQFVFFPGTASLGASGVVFAMILLSSVTGGEEKGIPLTLILVAALYLGQQIYEMITVQGHVNYIAHITGGAVGGAAGLLMKGRGRS